MKGFYICACLQTFKVNAFFFFRYLTCTSMCWCILAHGSCFFSLSHLILFLQTRNFNLWVGEITVNANIRRFFQLFCSVKAKSLSLCVSLQLWPPHIPVCVQRYSSRAWKTRTWPFVSMRENVLSLKLWLEFTDTAGGSNGGLHSPSSAPKSPPFRFPLTWWTFGSVSFRLLLFTLQSDCVLPVTQGKLLYKCTWNRGKIYDHPNRWSKGSDMTRLLLV